MKPHQKINHFPGMLSLSRKNNLARNLMKMSKSFPTDYNFFPPTWLLPSQYSELKSFSESDLNAVVIVKPQASCQGRGIFLSKSPQDFNFRQHSVVQKYLKRPFLIDGLKFDLRIYVLIADCDPLRIYVYTEGLARFATEPYHPPRKENFSNLYMHLTNYAINKNNEKFQFNESSTEMDKGHKRSLTSILSYLASKGYDCREIWDQIKNIIVKTVISTQPLLAHHYRSCQPQNYANNMCFQILGFDIILDSSLKPYILEVNYTPSFTTDSPLDRFIKENLIKDTLILMNLTNKAKDQCIHAKRKEIAERTLTGKKVWYSKEEREVIVMKWQAKRNAYESRNLGSFEKAYPVGDQGLMSLYEQFLNYSTECYLNLTGANIRRNQKVVHHSTTTSMDEKVGPRLTNTEQIERIYKNDLKFTLPKKQQKEDDRNAVSVMMKSATNGKPSTTEKSSQIEKPSITEKPGEVRNSRHKVIRCKVFNTHKNQVNHSLLFMTHQDPE